MDNTENKPGLSLAEQALGSMIKDVAAELGDPKNAEVHRIREDIFVNVFLPIFAGEKSLYVKQGADIHLWQSFAGGPYREVSVIDGSGGELFRVPPLFNVSAMKPLDGTGSAQAIGSVTDMIARASLIAKQGEARMNHYLVTELHKRDFMFANTKDESEYIQRWNDIFARYNRPLINMNANGVIVKVNDKDDFQCSEFDPV